MIKATITIDPEVSKAAKDLIKEQKIRGGFSGYVEILVKEDLTKKGYLKDKK